MLKKQGPANRRKLLAVILANSLTTTCALAAEPIFELGTVQVNASHNPVGEIGEDQVSSVVTREEMRTFNRDNVADAVNLLSGITVSNNSRNEKMINLRGYDVRQVPLFIDGIPVYVPYDGYVDFNRFTTADLSAIQVAKGFSSVSFGPNALGGAINLISRKPQSAFEGDVSAGVASGKQQRYAVNVGSNLGLWYIQAGASYSDADYFPLSKDFKATATENGGHRENSYAQDSKLSFKVGLTPNATDEYAISYYKQDGEKGQPPSTDPGTARYWQWPYWNKDSLYYVSRTALGEHETLKLRLYQDKFANEIQMYTNGSYSKLSSPITGVSDYNDKTYGGSLELSSTRLSNNEIKFVTHYKDDKHVSTDGAGVVGESFEDTLVSFALEDNWWLRPDLLLSAGLSQHTLNSEEVYKSGWTFTKPGKMTATNGQLGLFYDLTPTARFYTTVAQKTRLPTLKDRFSLKFGTYMESPNLQQEESVNYEIGYQGSPWQGAHAEAAVFYSDITDKIQSVLVAGSASTGKCKNAKNVAIDCSQMQNVGKVQSSGFELGLRTPLASWLDVGANYTYLDLKNVSSPNTKLTDMPRNKFTTYAIIRPFAQLDIIPFIETNSDRWVSNTVRLAGFTTINLKATYRPLKNLSLEAGVNNLTDENYSLADGFPNPGRVWFANANYQF